MVNSKVNPNIPRDILTELNTWNANESKTYINKAKMNSRSINNQTPLIKSNSLNTRLTTSDITQLIKKQLESSNPSTDLLNARITTLEKFKVRIREKRQGSFTKIMSSLKSKIENCCKKRGWIDSLDYIEKVEKQLITQLPINRINSFLRTNYRSQITTSSFNTGNLPEKMKTDRLLSTTIQLLNTENEQLEVSDPKHLPRTPSLANAPHKLKVSGEFIQDVDRLKSVKLNQKALYSINETNENDHLEKSKSDLEAAQKQLEQTKFNLSTRLTGELGPVAFQRLTSLMTQSSFKDFIDDLRFNVFPAVSTSVRDPICPNPTLAEDPEESGVDFVVSFKDEKNPETDKEAPDVISLTAKMTIAVTQLERKGILTIGYLSLYREYSAPRSECWPRPARPSPRSAPSATRR